MDREKVRDMCLDGEGHAEYLARGFRFMRERASQPSFTEDDLAQNVEEFRRTVGKLTEVLNQICPPPQRAAARHSFDDDFYQGREW